MVARDLSVCDIVQRFFKWLGGSKGDLFITYTNSGKIYIPDFVNTIFGKTKKKRKYFMYGRFTLFGNHADGIIILSSNVVRMDYSI